MLAISQIDFRLLLRAWIECEVGLQWERYGDKCGVSGQWRKITYTQCVCWWILSISLQLGSPSDNCVLFRPEPPPFRPLFIPWPATWKCAMSFALPPLPPTPPPPATPTQDCEFSPSLCHPVWLLFPCNGCRCLISANDVLQWRRQLPRPLTSGHAHRPPPTQLEMAKRSEGTEWRVERLGLRKGNEPRCQKKYVFQNNNSYK